MTENIKSDSYYDHTNTTDTFLINLHQDWLLTKQLFGITTHTEKMINSLEEEIKCRNLKPVPYTWTDPRVYELMNKLEDETA